MISNVPVTLLGVWSWRGRGGGCLGLGKVGGEGGGGGRRGEEEKKFGKMISVSEQTM